jgi:hypothetical protein
MGDSKIRGIIAILTVVFFILIVGIMVLSPILGFGTVDKENLNYFVSSLSGIIGVILGYYFRSGIESLKGE